VGADVVGAAVVVVIVVAAGGGHDSDTPAAGSGNFAGSEIADRGVPVGTFTVSVIVCPPKSDTVTVHDSAAAGAALATTAVRVAASAAATPPARRLDPAHRTSVFPDGLER